MQETEPKQPQSPAEAVRRAHEDLSSGEALENSNPVKLNCGGVIYETSREILTRREPNSVFHALFSGRWPASKDAEGTLAFPDARSGADFKHLLAYLRDGNMPYMKPAQLRPVLEDAEYFQARNNAAVANRVAPCFP